MIQARPEDCVRLCEVGETVYRVSKTGIVKETVDEVKNFPHTIYRLSNNDTYFNRAVGKTFFKTYEEAEEEVRQRANIKRKRELLKEYERKLNEEMNIKNHYIIK